MSVPFKPRVATVDAVKNNLINCTISSVRKTTPVQGTFVAIEANDNFMLGRVLSVDMHNPIHEDDRFASMLMENGFVPEWSGETDIERGVVEIITVIDKSGNFKSRDVNPKSGTQITQVDEKTLKKFYQEREHYAVIGRVAGCEAFATVINRSFGDYESGGYGEARHEAVFGKNGSGKTVWALTRLGLRLAAHPHMGCLLPDTQGDFSDATKHSRGSYKFDYKKLLSRAGVSIEVITIDDIALKSTSILKRCLKKVFAKVYSIAGEKAETLANHVVNSLFDSQVNVDEVTAKIIGEKVIEYIGQVYAKASRKEKEEDAARVMTDAGRFRSFKAEIDLNVRPYFTGNIDMSSLVMDVLTGGRKAVIAMEGMNSGQQTLVMEELMRVVKNTAQRIYKGAGATAQAIIVLDEAARWCPQSTNGSNGDLADSVLSGMKETRKAGLGWFIIAQSPADIDKAVLKQAHMTWFGRGLGIGVDENHLKSVLGDTGLHHYKALQMQAGRYFWIGAGLDNNIGTDTSTTAVLPFDEDVNAALVKHNKHIFGAK